ncbi:MAG: hypothetical protein QXD66_05610 [Candidatus Nezhaarchaeales archaeon]|nr:MAG: hypothetical protein DSO06_07075 [Candidatus Nezhaarchaeota archaeon WYZ-LMO8]TDA34223.1 MAG: hypothetical protein DSO05_06890 [Candidatus Nezhaarchaeota archaeon WYZ-LMO7]
MKRERRVLAITGDKEIVVSVLYRGKLWFESVDVKVLRCESSIEETLRSKYLNQARTILVDEGLLKSYDDPERTLSVLKSMEGRVDVIIVKDEDYERSRECKKYENTCSQINLLEALRVARKIFYEVRKVIQKN